MGAEKQSFTIRASASRLEKGLLAIPQRFKDLFPSRKGPIQVVFDDEEKSKALTFHPYDPVVKENRIFGLGQWFSMRGVREGDVISITVEDPATRKYRIALDRFVRERREEKSRQKLRSAQTDSEVEQELATLSRLTRKRPRELARQELLRIAQESLRRPRPRVLASAAERHEGPARLGFCFENYTMGSASFVRSLLKKGTAKLISKYIILTLRSVTTLRICSSSVQTVTLSSSTQQ